MWMLREKHYFYVLAVAPSQYIFYLQLSLSLSQKQEFVQ